MKRRRSTRRERSPLALGRESHGAAAIQHLQAIPLGFGPSAHMSVSLTLVTYWMLAITLHHSQVNNLAYMLCHASALLYHGRRIKQPQPARCGLGPIWHTSV